MSQVDRNFITTHYYSDNTGGATKTADIPIAPTGDITVVDWICCSVTSTTAVGGVQVGIRRADGTHVLYMETAPIAAIGVATSVRVTFDKGFPCYFPTFASGAGGFACEQSQVLGTGLECFMGGTGATVGSVSFSYGYHFEPKALRSSYLS